MSWQNPWAWLGALTVALPVLIHLLARGHARVQPFPSLRFLAPSRALPTRRTRVRDVVLLATRIAILVVAVAALAGPRWRSAREASATGAPARVVVIDTSASMQRITATGDKAVTVAQREGRRLANEARVSRVIESAMPSRVLPAAVEWLARQRGVGEIVIVSDFQLGALDASDVDAVPKSVGLRPSRVAIVPDAGPVQTRARAGDVDIIARTTVGADRTSVEWNSVPAARAEAVPLVLGGAAQRAAVDAAQRAGSVVGVRLPFDSTRRVAIVYAGYEQHAALTAAASLPHSAWATDVVARLHADSLLTSAVIGVRVELPNRQGVPRGLVVARTERGTTAVMAMEGPLDGRQTLLLLPFIEPGSLASAALVAATRRALSAAPPLTELEPRTLADAAIAAWQRAPAPTQSSTTTDSAASDGRWLWLLVLALLGLETWMRRARREPLVEKVKHDRAA